FNASASRDADGDVLKYHWDFGDGQSASGPVAKHTYKGPGEYMVRLLLDDGRGTHGSISEANVKVMVNAPPVAVIDIR
ncbi:MAG: PKD domain-containing protein, partial [Candidatus Omnitrophica bacterium]|nr:PKD domain-containing protein [Candidatus Omnitrophota bacterium]